MKVSDLIEKLREMPPDSEVVYYDGDAAGLQPVEKLVLRSHRSYDDPIVELEQ